MNAILTGNLTAIIQLSQLVVSERHVMKTYRGLKVKICTFLILIGAEVEEEA
jgi:hypothetical protein